MANDNQVQRSDLAWLQVLLAIAIAVFSGSWAVTTYKAEQRRIQEQRARDERQTQEEAIAQMSRHLGLMQAQCEPGDFLRVLADDPMTSRQERCYNGFIEARSLVFLSRIRIIRDSTVSESEWQEKWDSLDVALSRAGAMGYFPSVLSTRWRRIVENSKGNGGR